ncbi:hypothetical protein WJX84_001595 [Apatococcus fuscideae]|uniref:Rho-GAP domain-containing protein n=1 Tax=Apatococcus fuscideae TaxID=2026836 RepID=A0AAW1TDW3_9CHLO
MSRSNYGALSDDDDDEALVTPATHAHDDPFDDHVMARTLSSETKGHFVSPEASPANVQRRTPGFARAGSLGKATDKPLSMQDKLQAWRKQGAGFATYLRDKAGQMGSTAQSGWQERDWQGTSRGVAERAQAAAATSGEWLSAVTRRTTEAASQQYQRFAGGPLAALCKAEANKPCPRVVLICCAALVSCGLDTEALFQQDAPVELVHYLLGALEESQGTSLPPPGTSPHILANALKQFFITLPEPLFTYKLMPDLLEAGATSPARTTMTVLELPPANKATLQLLLETLHRVAGNAVHNGMDAAALGTALAPYLAWLPPPKVNNKGYGGIGQAPEGDMSRLSLGADSSGGSPRVMSHRSDLTSEQLHAIAAVITHLITTFRAAGEASGSLYSMGTSNVLGI